MKISPVVLASASAGRRTKPVSPWTIPKPPPGVIPQGAKLAMDEAPGSLYAAGGWLFEGMISEGLAWPGYQYLSELAQRSEYRLISEVPAEEMTRKGWRLTSRSGDDKTEVIRTISAEMERFRVEEVIHEAILHDGMFGRGQISIDVGASDKPEELLSPLLLRPEKIAKGSLEGFHCIEPVWTYPGIYNTTNPLRGDFYRPESWYVMGQTVHASRLLMLISRPMPQILLPAYSFAGISLSQLVKPYVDEWIRTKKSVADLVKSFTTWVIKTNMGAILQGDSGDGLEARAQLLAGMKDNRDVLMLDKDTEDFSNIAAPLSSLDKLQAQAQEHVSAAARQPLVKFTGITPSGLNASSDGEIRCFYDTMAAQQNKLIRKPLLHMIHVIMLNTYGAIDPDIGVEFEPLWELDEVQQATVRKTEADTAAVYVQAGVIDPEEERARLAAEPGSAYATLDLEKAIEPPEAEAEQVDETPGVDGPAGPSSPAA